MIPADAIRAARAYGIDPGRLKPVASAYRPAAAYRAGGVLLKPYRYGERQLYYATQALRHLEAERCPLAPRLVEARDGESYIRLGNTWWYATTWIEGRRPQWPADLPGAAASLAAFHAASEGCFIPYSPSRSWRRRWEGLLADLVSFRGAAEAGTTEFDRKYRAAAAPFIRQAMQCCDALTASGYDRLEQDCRGRRAFCHRDVTTANLVVDTAGRVCLVDPDTWGPELRIHDLTRLLLAGAGAEPEQSFGALAAYEAAAGALSAPERRLLGWAYLLPREFWWAGVCRYRRPAPGVDPADLLEQTLAGARARTACARVVLRGH